MTEAEFLSNYNEAKKEQREWQKNYDEFERIANNDLAEDLDPNEPETNDGSLSASLFKLQKRVVPKDLTGAPKALDRNDQWLNEFAKIEWTKTIVPNANTQAPFQAKWKDAVRKAGIYGSVPLVTILTELPNGKTSTDFFVAYPRDVALEVGKVSDSDSDEFWVDLYFTDRQLKDIIKAEKAEKKKAKDEGYEYNPTWDTAALQELIDVGKKDDKDSRDLPRDAANKMVKRGGKKIVMRLSRGVGEKFIGYAPSINKFVREYENPDPTGDPGVHYLYCYQDFINPYGIGIVKLAGGTQNVLDYMRRADVLATQVGIRSPLLVSGDTSETDFDTFVYSQDAIWIAGKAQVQRQNLGNGIYEQLPGRLSMYKTSLNQLIPTGDTSISSTDSGDPNYSKTPQGVKFQQANLSIDDEDMTEKLYIAFEQVAKSMINVHFANMQGTDVVKLSEVERERIYKASPQDFPQFAQQQLEDGTTIEPSDELEVIWDNVRANYEFEVEAEPEKQKDEAEQLDGLLKVLELVNADPTFEQQMLMAGKKFNKGELLSDIIKLSTDNEKIIVDISPEEQGQMEAEQAAMQEQQLAAQELPQEQQMDMGQELPQENQELQIDPDILRHIENVMQTYQVNQNTALMMLEAEQRGIGTLDEIAQMLQGAVNA